MIFCQTGKFFCSGEAETIPSSQNAVLASPYHQEGLKGWRCWVLLVATLFFSQHLLDIWRRMWYDNKVILSKGYDGDK